MVIETIAEQGTQTKVARQHMAMMPVVVFEFSLPFG
jgi:hypothetical protein